MFLIYLLVLCAVNIDGAREGEMCTHNDVAGVCVELSRCSTMLEDPILWKLSPACHSRGSSEIVCCKNSTIQKDLCEPLPASMTTKKTGMKAWDKCIDYQQLVYPCRDGIRQHLCPHEAITNLFLGSNTHAKRNEFPHAVLLGYTNEHDQLDWLCGGTLVSERFVLTAGHCIMTRLRGSPTHVAIHPTDRSDIDPDTIYKVKAVLRHPEYKPPKTYHDIALVELEHPVPLTPTTVPACLLLHSRPSDDAEDPSNVIATTWNTNDILDTGITWLRKVRLSKYSIDECSRLYPDSRRGGYNDFLQLCYGDQAGVKDICQDDGGNPLVVENSQLSCMYTVVGVTSYGRGCFAHSPGVYTRVQRYLPWIESVVWP